jgi:predicted component of type VI protein secretion system
MPIKLLVASAVDTSAVDTEAPDEYRFEEDRVTIGRASENLLTLPDPKRVVSKEHAEIRDEDGRYKLVDRGSKNFTYLNGKRLRSGRPYDIQSGDTFEIGDFELTFEIVREDYDASPSGDETVFAESFVNPFEEPASTLTSALGEIVDAYDEVPSPQRLDALRDAFRQTGDVEGDHEAVALVGRLLGLENGAAPAAADDHPAEARKTAAGKAEDRKAEPQEAAAHDRAPAGEKDDEEDADDDTAVADGNHREALFGVLVEAVARAVRIPWQFRHEFIGQTIVQSSAHGALYEGDADALASYLTEPSLDDDEAEERLRALQDAVDKLLVHQMAMLDGYKAGVQNGARQLLEEMNPEAKENEVREEHRLYDLFPFFGQKAAMEALQGTYRELQGEDWSVAERRIFRPAFNKAYLARMTSAPDPDDEADH